MVIARLENGELVVHNPVALEDQLMKEIEGWGTIAWIVVPNGYHRLDSRIFHERYPSAKVLAPRGARKKVEEVVPVSGDYDAFPADPRVTLEMVDGVGDAEGVLKVRSDDGTTLVVTDLVFNMPHLHGFQGFVLKHLTQSSGGPRISRIGRILLIKDKAKVRANLERLAETPALKRIVVGHHQTIVDRPADALREVAKSL
jgi:hypothetical protein